MSQNIGCTLLVVELIAWYRMSSRRSVSEVCGRVKEGCLEEVVMLELRFKKRCKTGGR